ncbi:MAG: YfhO family protein, partial [Clostridia bacterium]|nr:YfhO family protein [Clostridia bacterium]
PKSSFAGDYDEFVALKSDLDEHDGDDTYRMELVDSRARMDPAWYGYNGVSTFTSMAYEKLSNTQSNLGMFGNYINSYTYNLQTPVYNMMHSLKYIVDNSTDVDLADDYYSQLMTSGKFTAYQNDYYLPIGYSVEKSVRLWYSDKTNPFEVQGDWFEKTTGVSDVFKRMDISEVRYFQFDEITSGLETGDIYFTKPNTGEGEATFFLSVPEARHCYLFVDSSAFEEITINKGDESHVQNVSEPYIYDLGIVSPDEFVTVLIKVKDRDYGYIDFYPYYVDDEALNKGYEILKQGQLNVTSFEDTKITGTATAAKDSVFFTSIPYDKGWKIKIDGKEIDESDYIALDEAYLCFNIPAGTHEIELEFEQRGFVIGVAITGATIVLMILVAYLFTILKKKNEEKIAFLESEMVRIKEEIEVQEALKEVELDMAENDSPDDANDESESSEESDETEENVESNDESVTADEDFTDEA